jgi:hypothetical protein
VLDTQAENCPTKTLLDDAVGTKHWRDLLDDFKRALGGV